MSAVMMKVLQQQVESLTRQVEQLGPENERVRKLLTEFDERHDRDQARLEALEAENARLREALEPFGYALKAARHSLGEMPDRADLVAIACRYISYGHLKDALSEVVQAENSEQE